MEKCPNQEEIDHHVQTGILIEHIDTSYLFRDKGIRKSIKKFAEAYGQAKTPNKFWVSKSSPAFLASVILSVARAIVDDSRERVANKGRHARGFDTAYQQRYEFDTSEEDDSDDEQWIPAQVVDSIDTEAAKAAVQVVSLKRKSTEELQADIDEINQQIAAAQKADVQKAEKKKPRKA